MNNKYRNRLPLIAICSLLLWWCFSLIATFSFLAGTAVFWFIEDYIGMWRMRQELLNDALEEDIIYDKNAEFHVLWGTQENYKKHFKQNIPQVPLRIMRAATVTPDGVIYSVSPPGRHHNCHQAMYELSDLYGSMHHKEEGFIDSQGNFLSREDAVILARSAQQLYWCGLPKTNPVTELFSEDLW